MSLIHSLKTIIGSSSEDSVSPKVADSIDEKSDSATPLTKPISDPTQETPQDSKITPAKAPETPSPALPEKLSAPAPETSASPSQFPSPIHNLETDGFEKSLIWSNDIFDVLKKDILENPTPCVIVPSGSSAEVDCSGKVQLAMELAWEMVREKHFKAVLNVPARDANMLTMRLALLVKKQVLNLPEQNDVQESNRFDAALRWLQSEKHWLIVFNGVDTLEAQQTVIDLLPKLRNGKAVITSRQQDWPEETQLHTLNSLALDEGADVLLKVTDQNRKKLSNDLISSQQLVRVLGGNPTALQLVASYINSNRSSLSHFLYKAGFKGLEAFNTDIPKGPELNHNHGKALRMNLKTLRPEGTTLMKVLAYFADTPIEIRLLEQQSDVLTQAHRLACKLHNKRFYPFNLSRAIGELSRVGLISRSNECITVPRFILAFLHPRLLKTLALQRKACGSELPLKNYALKAALKLLHNAAKVDPREIATHDYWHLLNPHIERVIDFCNQAGQIDKTLYLMSQWALFLKSEGHIEKAEELYRRIIAIGNESETLSGTQDTVGMNNLAQILAATKRFEESESLMIDVLGKLKSRFGADNPVLAKPLTNLARIYQMAHQREEAEMLLRQALTIAKRHYDEPHETVETLLVQLSDALKEMTRYDEAESVIRQAMCELVGRRSENCPEMPPHLCRLGFLFMLKNDHKEAEKTFQRAIQISERSFGKHHIAVSRCLDGIIRLYLMSGNWRKAKVANERNLKIYEATYGPHHPRVLKPLKIMVSIYKTQREWDHAVALQERVLKLEEQQHGMLSIAVASAMREMAKLYLLVGETDTSEALNQKSKTISSYLKPKGPGEPEPTLPEFSELEQSA